MLCIGGCKARLYACTLGYQRMPCITHLAGVSYAELAPVLLSSSTVLCITPRTIKYTTTVGGLLPDDGGGLDRHTGT